MSDRGFACMIWDVEAQEWASLGFGVDRERCEALAERVREICWWPARVVEVGLEGDEFIVLAADLGLPVESDVIGADSDGFDCIE